MPTLRVRRSPWLPVAAVAFSLPFLLSVPSRADSKKPAPAPAKPASAPKPAAAPHPSGGGSTPGHPGASGGAAGSHPGGATTTTHTGPTTGNPHNGPTTGSPHGPTTGTSGGHTTTTTTGNHPSTTGPSHNPGVAGSHPGSTGAANRTATGRPAPTGSHTVQTKSGGAVTRRANGRISDVHDAHRNMDIHHNLGGGRRVSVERADHSRIVAERGRRGYIERRYEYHGHDFARRSYYWHGHEYPRYYRGYYYRGAYVHVYAPAYYYPPAYYGWAYNPWPAPVPYAWGWAPNPWYGYYGYYFAPYPVYAGPAFWLTDYLIAAELQAAYAAGQASAANNAENLPPSLYLCQNGGCGTLAREGERFSGTLSDGTALNLTVAEWNMNGVTLNSDGTGNGSTYQGTLLSPSMVIGTVNEIRDGKQVSVAFTASANAPVLVASNAGGFFGDSSSAPALSPEIKQMVADEVKGQIALENSEATQNSQGQDADPSSSGIERLMSDGKPHVFVAGDSMDVVDDSGAECALSDGDVLQLNSAPEADSTDAKLVVLSSKGTKECAKSATVTVPVSDLQEMQNHLRETIDQGMQDLKDKQGKNGLPAAPASAKGDPVQSELAKNAPPAEQDGEKAINDQLSEADKAEQQASQEAPADSNGATESAQAAAPAGQAPTVNIEVGQTVDQVTASLGQPLSIIDLGTKKIYKYKDMKITFKAGKVADVDVN